HTLQARMAHDLQDTTVTLLAVGTDSHHRSVGLHFTAHNTADTDDPQEAVVVQLGDLHLEWAVQINRRRRHVVNDRLERSEEHTSELQSRENLVCRLLLEKKKIT